jgi:hypothetical protein
MTESDEPEVDGDGSRLAAVLRAQFGDAEDEQ